MQGYPGNGAYLGLARTIYIRFIYGSFGREITKHTAIYSVYIRFWPSLEVCKGGLDDRGMHPVRLQRRVGQSPEVICLKEGLTEHASHMRPMHKVYKSAALYLGPVPSAWPCLYHILLFASALLQCNPACSCPLHDLLGLISVVSTEHTLPACSCPLHDLLELISAVSSEHTLLVQSTHCKCTHCEYKAHTVSTEHTCEYRAHVVSTKHTL